MFLQIGLAFYWFSVGVCLVERIVLGSGGLSGNFTADPFFFTRNSGVEHTCLALWMRVWITDSFGEMSWLEFSLSTYLCGRVFCRQWIQWSLKWVWSGYLGRAVHVFLGVLWWIWCVDLWNWGVLEVCWLDLSWWHCGHHQHTWTTIWLMLEI